MSERTITRAHLSESVYQEVGLSRNESADLLEMVLAEISQALAKGEIVKISSFGTFSVRKKGQRVKKSQDRAGSSYSAAQGSCFSAFPTAKRPD